jgi:hypothetical protein
MLTTGARVQLVACAAACFVVLSLISCADAAEGLSPLEICFESYVYEWGEPSPPSDPNAPPTGWPTTRLPPQPVTIPPYLFTKWPFGSASAIGPTVPNSQGVALMKAFAANGLR